METFEYAILPWLILVVIMAGLVIIYNGQQKTAPMWVQKTSFRILLVSKWLLYVFAAVLCLVGVGVLLLQDVPMWLAPESKFGYANKYELPDNKVFVEPKPHDCEWGKAPLGNKYCHYEKKILTDKDPQGKVVAVYVRWEKIQE